MDNYTVASLLAATCIVFYTAFYIMTRSGQRRHLHEQASKFPGPPNLPFIRHARFVIGNAEAILNGIIQVNKSYPSPYRFWVANHLVFVVNTPEQMKVVLNSPKTMDKGPFYEFAAPWLGTGLLTGPAATAHAHRKLMQPAFTRMILQSYMEIFAARSAIMVKKMEKNVNGPELDVYSYTSQYSLHTICETTMGVDLENHTTDNDLYTEAVHEVAAGFCYRAVRPWLYPDFIFNRTKLGKEQQKYIKYLHDFTDNVIQTKKKTLLEQSLSPGAIDRDENDTPGTVLRKKILLDYLMEVAEGSERLSDEALHEEVATIIVTGCDTTAVISSYVMLMLSYHPEIQEKVYQELWEIYGDTDSEILHFTPSDLTRMTYLGRVIQETIRLFPIAPFITRLVTEDLDIGEHTLPKDSLVLLFGMDLHRSEKYWPDPLKFDPDRFLPEEVEKRDPCSYVAFSGQKYAMTSIKILLTTVLRKYVLKKDTITPMKDLRFKWEIVLRPVHPIALKIERRTNI